MLAQLRRNHLSRPVALAGALAASALTGCASPAAAAPPPFANLYPAPEDAGRRAPPGYFLRRAWVQLTRDLAATRLPEVVPLDLADLERRPFAVAWLGHSTLLVRAAGKWLLTDPALFEYVGPVPPFGPRRLTALPFRVGELPHIDVVLVSHDHFDHLDLPSVRHLARQPGGPPRFLVGRGLAPWFREHVGVPAEEHGWWDTSASGALALTFVPAQHSCGRSPGGKNRTLWGGWAIAWEGRTFYFAGDTAFVAELFLGLRDRLGPIDLAAIPIGAYAPRGWMRFEHVDPAEAVEAHRLLGARRTFGVHWATFQLGDEEPYQPALDLEAASSARGVQSFGVLPVGGVADVGEPPVLAGPEANDDPQGR